jgi:hypothetical protein
MPGEASRRLFMKHGGAIALNFFVSPNIWRPQIQHVAEGLKTVLSGPEMIVGPTAVA